MRRFGICLVCLVLSSAIAGATDDGVPYAQVKRAVAAVRAAGQASAIPAGPYEIPCGAFQDFTGAVYGDRAEAPVEAYADVADRVLGLEADLPRIGYPERAWSAWLARYERDAIATRTPAPNSTVGGLGLGDIGHLGVAPRARIHDPAFEGLRLLLARYRRAHRRARPVVLGVCVEGEGERAIAFVSRPAATHVFIIPSFFYELCRVRKIDPEDTSRCEHWREVLSAVVPVSGSYHYVAKWADGTTARGILDEEDPASRTITLRKP